ncbi:uncharacterized protein [Macrobrachium rosenbergii]|uniref:uncharacterized protein n=1 Tax=Macrobrachium rosenbergii TaxID=79674 RepID=UPI0034D5F3D8
MPVDLFGEKFLCPFATAPAPTPTPTPASSAASSAAVTETHREWDVPEKEKEEEEEEGISRRERDQLTELDLVCDPREFELTLITDSRARTGPPLSQHRPSRPIEPLVGPGSNPRERWGDEEGGSSSLRTGFDPNAP